MRRLVALFLLFVGFPAWAAVNLNTADMSELETLPGIGPSKAAAIIQYRTDNGPFKTVDELDNVAGIGPSTLASLRDLVTVSGGGSAAGSTSTGSGASAGTTTTTTTSTATSAPAAGCPVNINTADTAGLENLPGIGASKAAAILQYRIDSGPYKSCDDLDNVSGIGPATIAGLADCCTVK